MFVTVLCIVCVLAALTAGNGYVHDFVTGFLITPIQQTAAGAVAWAGSLLTPPRDRMELETENSRLEAENKRLNDLLVDYYDVKRDYEELSKFYDIKKDNPSFTLATAAVIGRDPNENFYGFTLDRGMADNIEINSPVLTEKGLVGWVSEVSMHSCKVTTILSPDARIAAADKKVSENGVICGRGDLSDKGLTYLTNLRDKSKIAVNDMVVTSGYGGIYPENIKVGKVKEMVSDSCTGMPAAVIEPFENPQEVSSVVIVKDFTGKETVQ